MSCWSVDVDGTPVQVMRLADEPFTPEEEAMIVDLVRAARRKYAEEQS